MKKFIVFLVFLVFLGAPAFSGGVFERTTDRDAPNKDATVEPVVVPDWVEVIESGDWQKLYPGPDGGGFIGVGTGSSREESIAAAAVDFAGNISTEVEAAVIQRETASDAETSEFLLQVESDVRSQAIISGMNPDVWEDPRTGVWYTLYRTTQEEYRRRLEEWISVMETMSAANRAREVQRLEDERAAAERRQEQIKLEELQEQIRLADRRMRADRHRSFLYHYLPARDRRVPTGYLPDDGEFTLGFTGGFDTYLLDGSLDFSFWRVFLFGVDGTIAIPRDDDLEYGVESTGRLMVQLLSRAGWVTSTTLAIGAFGTVAVGGDDDWEWLETGSWYAGPFLTADVLVPELAHTRYSLYAGFDHIQGRIGWYPFWRSVEEGVGISVAGNFDIYDEDGHFAGIGLEFRPVEAVRIVLESRNLSYLRGAITISR